LIAAILTFVFMWCLFYGRVPQPFLFIICAVPGIFFALNRGHNHYQFLSNDVLAQISRLKNVNPALKFWTLLALMFICVASRNFYTGLFLTAAMFVIIIIVSGVNARHYAQAMALPVSFLMIGGLALLFEFSSGPTGILNIGAFGYWLTVGERSQSQTALVVSRAFGAVSCLCALSMTTPMPDIIGVLRRARCPDFFIDLMYLIYRYIFILISLHHEMRVAAASRLGFRDYRASLRTIGKIYANLLARSYQFAGRNFDAMESRCYDAGIRFFERPKRIAFSHLCVSMLFLGATLFLCRLPL